MSQPRYPYVDFHMAMDVHPMYVVCRSFPWVLTVIVKAGCLFEVVSSMSSKFGDPYSTTYASIFCFRRKSWEISHVDVGQNPVPPVNLKVDGHPLYQMISRF